MKNQSGIYEIFNTVNGKRYIGSAKKFGYRWWTHKRDLKAGAHHNRHLQAAWEVYGADAFVFRPLLICAPAKKMLLMYEQRAIDAYNPEYNIMRIADSHQGVKRTPETCARLSAALTGKHHSDETKEKIRVIRTGTTASEETKAKMSATQSTIPHKPLSEETKAKLSALWIGTTRTEEDCRKISEGQLGKKKKPHTAETKAHLSAVLKGRPVAPNVLAARIGRKQTPEHIANRIVKQHTPETKEKMSRAHQAYWAAKRATTC
jgi:group I intron endonuclease